jgi:group I intron endonuclease
MHVIYKITCAENKKFYIGSTVNKNQRWARHRRQLRDGTHPNKQMLASWVKYGEDAFLFEVLEVLETPAELFTAEQKYLDEHAGKDYCFNWSLYAGAPMRGKKGDETPNHGRKFGPEFRAKVSASVKGSKHPNWGKKLSDETKEKIRQSNLLHPHKERKHTPEAIAKIAAASRGRPVSDETRAKRSAALKGREIPLGQRLRISKTLSGEGNYWYGKKRPDHGAKVRKAVATYRDGVLVKTYASISELRAEFGATPTTVNRLLKSGKPAYGSIFKDLSLAYVDAPTPT